MTQKMGLREFIDDLQAKGYTVGGSKQEDPVLLMPDGKAVETWKEGYPYDELMPREEYDEEKYRLQVELLKFQYWAQDVQRKFVVLFEGRDAAGKGGTIKRFTEHLNPRGARVVALGKPTDRESGQWYFQRYVQHLPTDGEIVLERLLSESGVHVTKLWFSVTQQEQRTRFAIRQLDPVRRWKLSPMDLESLDKWEAYTAAKEEMFERTDTKHARWTTVRSNDKKRARVNSLRFFLDQFDYEGKDTDVVHPPDKKIVGRGKKTVGD